MRIVHVTDCYLPRLGGIERQVHDLALHQQATGHDVEIVTSVATDGGPSPLRVHRPPGDTGEGIRYTASRLGAATVRAGSYDLVHVHVSTWSPLAFLAAREAAASGVPVAATVHSVW